MSEHHFGLGNGRITESEVRRVSEIATRHGAAFSTATGNHGHCTCGHGCRKGECTEKRWWFSVPNRGEPFDGDKAREVMAAVGAVRLADATPA